MTKSGSISLELSYEELMVIRQCILEALGLLDTEFQTIVGIEEDVARTLLNRIEEEIERCEQG